MLRTHTCGELTIQDVKKPVTLCGWVQTRRDHGGIIFIDVRDRYGITQLVFDPKHNLNAHKIAEHLGREWVLRAQGMVRPRAPGMANPKLHTGEIEIIADALEILNKAEVPPIEIEDSIIASEELRLTYRYLDLRRPVMQQRLILRHKLAMAARTFLTSQQFIEIETPLLVKPTPEGARDYLVPSRVNPGMFYALPQSPQLYKQILMISGMDRYFQLAKCLRDEDLRADRQPEFTQIDLEMSFCTPDDIYTLVEGIMHSLWKEAGHTLATPFVRISYKDSMDTYGTDKPDLRFELMITDVTEAVKHSAFSVFTNAIANKGVVKCLRVPHGASLTRTDLEQFIALAKTHHAQGLAWAKFVNNTLESSITKYLSPEVQHALITVTNATNNDILLFIADSWKTACTALGQVRLAVAEKQKLIQPGLWKFAWITEFPLFSWNQETQTWDAEHHPFCMPRAQDVHYLDTDPGKVYATTYDLALNGTELLSGSVRITNPELQKKIFTMIGLSEEEARTKFGFLLDAYKYGGPPHAGVGIGFDRIVALLSGTTDIREVMAFPKNKKAQCPMDGSPSAPTELQLKELHIKRELMRDAKA